MNYFKRTIDGEIGTLEFDTPESSVNILSSAALTELEQHLDEIALRSDIKALLITSAKKSIFIAARTSKRLIQSLIHRKPSRNVTLASR